MNNFRRRVGVGLILFGTLLWCILMLTGCQPDDTLSFRDVYEEKGLGFMTAQYTLFDGPSRSLVQVGSGQTITVAYRLDIQAGEIRLRVLGPLGWKIQDQQFTASSEGTVEISAPLKWLYTVEVRGSGAKGSYDVRWTVK